MSQLENIKINLFQIAILSAIMAALGNVIVFYIAQLAHTVPAIPLSPASEELKALTLLPVILASAFPAFVSAFVFFIIKKMAKKPLRDYLVLAIPFLIFSLGAPLSIPTSIPQKIVLIIMHLVAALFIIGGIVAYTQSKK